MFVITYLLGPAFFMALMSGLFYLVILLIARLVVRNDRAAWVVMFLTCVAGTSWILALTQPSLSIPSIETQVVAVAVAAVVVGVLNRHGLLACVVAVTVGVAILDTPFTLDMSRWYAWRTPLFGALMTGLAMWGFRNVLGRQTAFPGGEGDDS